jgi:hypothetical protein
MPLLAANAAPTPATEKIMATATGRSVRVETKVLRKSIGVT